MSETEENKRPSIVAFRGAILSRGFFCVNRETFSLSLLIPFSRLASCVYETSFAMTACGSLVSRVEYSCYKFVVTDAPSDATLPTYFQACFVFVVSVFASVLLVFFLSTQDVSLFLYFFFFDRHSSNTIWCVLRSCDPVLYDPAPIRLRNPSRGQYLSQGFFPEVTLSVSFIFVSPLS